MLISYPSKHEGQSFCCFFASRVLSWKKNQERKVRKRPLPALQLALSCSCSLSLLWSKLTGLNSKPVSFLVEWPYSVETTRWKFLSPQFLWRKPVLEVVSHVTHMLQIVKETPDESMIRTMKDPSYDVKTGLYRITC